MMKNVIRTRPQTTPTTKASQFMSFTTFWSTFLSSSCLKYIMCSYFVLKLLWFLTLTYKRTYVACHCPNLGPNVRKDTLLSGEIYQDTHSNTGRGHGPRRLICCILHRTSLLPSLSHLAVNMVQCS